MGLALVPGPFAVLLRAENSSGSIDGIYQGTIGRRQIVVGLSRVFNGDQGTNYNDPEDQKTYPIEGSYFYRSYGVSIDLAGMPLPDGGLRLTEYRQAGLAFEFTAEWRLTITGDQASGEFCKCDLTGSAKPAGPVLKVALRRKSQRLTPPESWQGYKPHSGNTYYDLLLDFPLKTGPKINVNETISYRMKTDPRFNVSLPELTRFPDRRIMTRINADLGSEFNENRLWAAAILSGGQFGSEKGGFYDTTVTVNVLPPDVFAVLVQSSWYSGGAHPNDGDYTLHYDLRAGKRFTLENSFHTPEGSTTEADVAGLLANLYQKHYPEPPDTVGGEDCRTILRRHIAATQDLIDTFAPRNSVLFLSREGLLIIPPLPHVYVGCGPPVTVPYKEIRPSIDKHSLLDRLIEHHTISQSHTEAASWSNTPA